jgi:NitT/TauT family transport system substrate-binding protein
LVTFLIGTGCTRRPAGDSVLFLTLKGPSAMSMVHLIDSSASLITERLKIEIIDEPMMVRARMLKESPEFAVLPMNMAAILYNMGLPYQVIAVPVWGTLYLVGKGNDSIGWPDLKGRKIYLMGKGTTPDILFRYLLNSQGLDPDRDLQLDYSFPTHIDLANAVIAGKAPLAVISEPAASLALARNREIREVMDLNKEWAEAFPENPTLPQTAFVGRMDYIRDHPGNVRLICEAWARSEASVNENPAGAAGKIAACGILPDSSVAIMAIPRSNLAFRYASELKPMIAHYLHVLFTFKPDAIGGQMPDEKFIFEIPVH